MNNAKTEQRRTLDMDEPQKINETERRRLFPRKSQNRLQAQSKNGVFVYKKWLERKAV